MGAPFGHKAYNRGKGKGYAWIVAHAAYDGDDCVAWPYSTNGTGYGCFGYNGKIHYAHRFMCELVNGPPPTPEHEASHNCGNGMKSCLNRKHLEWKTPSDNQLDRRRHGTAVTSIWGSKGKLTRDQQAEIIALKGQKPQREIAKMFGCHFQTVSRIHKMGLRTEYKSRVFHEKEDARLALFVGIGLRPAEIAEKMGRTKASVYGRIKRLRRANALSPSP